MNEENRMLDRSDAPQIIKTTDHELYKAQTRFVIWKESEGNLRKIAKEWIDSRKERWIKNPTQETRQNIIHQ